MAEHGVDFKLRGNAIGAGLGIDIGDVAAELAGVTGLAFLWSIGGVLSPSLPLLSSSLIVIV